MIALRVTLLIVQETNHLELFRRVPSDLRRYKQYTWKLKRDYGSVMNFVLQCRLGWLDSTNTGAPFSNPGWSELPHLSNTSLLIL